MLYLGQSEQIQVPLGYSLSQQTFKSFKGLLRVDSYFSGTYKCSEENLENETCCTFCLQSK